MLTCDEQSQMLPHGTNHQLVNSILDEKLVSLLLVQGKKEAAAIRENVWICCPFSVRRRFG